MDHQICACLKCWFNLIYISCVAYMLSSVTLLCHILWLLHISGHILHSLYSYKSAQLNIILCEYLQRAIRTIRQENLYQPQIISYLIKFCVEHSPSSLHLRIGIMVHLELVALH